MSDRRIVRIPALALAAALVLAGCANLAPEHQRPAAPVASAFPGEPDRKSVV